MRDHLTLKQLQQALGTSSPENAGQAFDPALRKTVRVARRYPVEWQRLFADEWERQEAESRAESDMARRRAEEAAFREQVRIAERR